jgi:hypothetical protein
MFFNDTVVINSLYELDIRPTKEQERIREAKIKASIEYLGDKYLLAKPVERKNLQLKGENHGS